MPRYEKVEEKEEGRKVEGAPPPPTPPLTTWKEEALEHLFIAMPVSINMLAYRTPWIVSIMFVGRIGETPLAAASVASTLGNVTGLSLLVGLSSGLATFGAQAFGKCVCFLISATSDVEQSVSARSLSYTPFVFSFSL